VTHSKQTTQLTFSEPVGFSGLVVICNFLAVFCFLIRVIMVEIAVKHTLAKYFQYVVLHGSVQLQNQQFTS